MLFLSELYINLPLSHCLEVGKSVAFSKEHIDHFRPNLP